MTQFVFRGGHLDGQLLPVGTQNDGQYPQVIQAADPKQWSVTDEIPSSAVVTPVRYYRTKVRDGDSPHIKFEYWTADRQELAQLGGIPLSHRVTDLERGFKELQQRHAALSGEVGQLRLERDREREANAGLAREVEELRALIVAQEGRFDRLIDSINCSSNVLGVATEYEGRTS